MFQTDEIFLAQPLQVTGQRSQMFLVGNVLGKVVLLERVVAYFKQRNLLILALHYQLQAINNH